jgi:subtilase family serine protease
VEEFERRDLLSGTSLLAEAFLPPPPDLEVIPAIGLTPQATPGAGGLTPAQVRRAYGFDRITFSNGTVAGDGSGQTIAIVTAYDDPYILKDLQTFDRQFGLPDPLSFTKVALKGTQKVNALWALETALDVQWAHAMAPRANLLLVEAASANLGDMLAAVDYARRQPGVTVVSMSWGASEFSVETYYDSYMTTPAGHIGGSNLPGGITFVSASGDDGASAGCLWPAVSPHVVSVGGTQLTVDASGTYRQEVGWSGSGGGYSRYETAPSYQRTVTGLSKRATPDVSYDGSGASPFWIYTSVPWSGMSGWLRVGGTSAGTPQWAGLLAVVNQGRALSGQGSLSSAGAALYALPGTAFHDVVKGNNGYPAKVGFDLVTGRGSPYADRIASQLVPPPANPSSAGLNLGLVATAVANFFQKTTGQAVTQGPALASSHAATVFPSLRLPSGAPFSLGSAPLSAGDPLVPPPVRGEAVLSLANTRRALPSTASGLQPAWQENAADLDILPGTMDSLNLG